VALSTYLPTLDELPAAAAAANAELPIFMAHGNADPVVDIQLARQVYLGLQAQHYPVQWREYPMQHNVSAAEISDIAAFLNGVLC
jgi:phospholipase/carboxylesterase